MSKQLPELPGSTAKFWAGSDQHSSVMGPDKKCEHFFKRIFGSQVVCEKCNMGFVADGSVKIEDGNLSL